MNFDFSEEQQMVRDSIARFVQDDYDWDTRKAIVEGVNMIRKHLKPNQENPNGGIIDQEAPIHISNLMLVENGTPTRTGRKRNENGKGWVRQEHDV